MKSRLAVSFGEVADRERRHPIEGVSRHLVALGKEASASGTKKEAAAKKKGKTEMGRKEATAETKKKGIEIWRWGCCKG